MHNPTTGPMSRYWAVSLGVLLAATYALWLPTAWTGTLFYPAIGLIPAPTWFTDFVAIGLLPSLLVGLALAFFADRRPALRRIGWFVVATALLLGFLTDQHRLQPWAYQSLMYAILFVLLPVRSMPVAMRMLTISIYFYSSLGKFDYQFLHTVGQEFLIETTSWLGIDTATWDLKTRLYAATSFPVSELLIALLVAIPATRVVGGWIAIAMHATLILVLSPMGMNHSIGVLGWNAVLAGQAYWLFVRWKVVEDSGDREMSTSQSSDESVEGLPFAALRSAVAGVIVVLAVILPLTERRDRDATDAWHWDHWLSWALYSPHNSRLQVEIHASVLDDLPAAFRDAVADDINDDSWHELDLGKLSLQTRGVPVLPQSRYQHSLAVELARSQGWTHEIRAVLRSSSDRFDGTRREQWLDRLTR